MAIKEVIEWEINARDNLSTHPTGPQGNQPRRIALSIQELQAAIARYREDATFGKLTITDAATFDKNETSGNTRFLVYDVDNGTLERVSVGAADSGGAGFKVLRIPN